MKQTFLSHLLISLLFASICGAEFQVNTYTTNEQKGAAIAMDAAGNFVVVWSSYGQDGSSNGVFAQRFDPNRNSAGEEFQVNATSSGNQKEPAVAMDAAAGFVVAWQGPRAIEDANEDIFAQRFDPNGLRLGDEFRVNSNTSDEQLYPAVAMNNNGSFIIVWESMNIPEEGNKAICGQLYDSTGVEFGAEFVINAEASVCRYPDVAADANGNFAVAWMRDKSSNSIMARLYNADGSAGSDAFEVSTIKFSSVTQPSIAMDAIGSFVVAWDGDPNLASLDDIHARLYEPNGTAAGEQFVVNTTAAGPQCYPQVAMNDQQGFMIAWEGRIDPNVNEREIFSQRCNSLGERLGDEFQVNTYALDDQRYPAVAISQAGRFITAWQSDGQDGSGYGIFAETGQVVGSADFTGDGLVDFRDYCILTEEWLEENPLTADVIGDYEINEYDLAAFCRQWLVAAPTQ
jgi:hypothetical protein